jgi:O-acetyl-ADP-ribose deacetylase (regulator of RNase III)
VTFALRARYGVFTPSHEAWALLRRDGNGGKKSDGRLPGVSCISPLNFLRLNPADGLMEIQFITGDATAPIGDGNKIIAHVCNDVGAWGAGFVLAISKRWPQPQAEYLKLSRPLTLGTVSVIQVEPAVWVANMIAQQGIRTLAGVPPLRCNALKQCLGILTREAENLKATIHMPRIGCGLAGGKWERVEPLIREVILSSEVFVYDLPH